VIYCIILSTYKIFLILGVAVIVVVSVIIGIPVAKQFVGISDYDIYVDAIIDNSSVPHVGRVLIQNTGAQSLTNVKIDFQDGDVLDLGTIAVRDRIILTTPQGNKMTSVTVFADQNVFVKKQYR
jgi:hypothetical protein